MLITLRHQLVHLKPSFKKVAHMKWRQFVQINELCVKFPILSHLTNNKVFAQKENTDLSNKNYD